MATALAELFPDRDAASLEAEMVAELEAAFEGWKPAAGNPEYWLIKTRARIGAALYEVASLVTRKSLRSLGQTIISVPPILAAPATVQSTWEAIDAEGPYLIPAGTEVTIVEAGEKYGFRTVEEVTIPAGKTTTDPGEVLLEAVEPGAAYNGLSTDPALSTSLAAIKPNGITLDGVTANGVDEETEDAYILRLTEELQTLTRSAVVTRDYEIIARRVPGVARATALNTYNPESKTFGNPLEVTVAVVDAAGAALSGAVKEAVEELLESRSLQNILTHVIDPTFTEVGVKVKGTIRAGYDEPAVLAAVEEQVASYLSPARWGLPEEGSADPGNSAGWENQLSVYVNEIIALADRVPGFNRVTSVELSKNGGAFGKADIELDGPAALAKPGTIEASTE